MALFIPQFIPVCGGGRIPCPACGRIPAGTIPSVASSVKVYSATRLGNKIECKYLQVGKDSEKLLLVVVCKGHLEACSERHCCLEVVQEAHEAAWGPLADGDVHRQYAELLAGSYDVPFLDHHPAHQTIT